MGPNTPPTVAITGIDAFLILESAPPGRKLLDLFGGDTEEHHEDIIHDEVE